MEKHIFFHSEDIDFNINNISSYINWINKLVKTEYKTIENLNFIFCSDKYLLNINKEYLNHDYYTDIITFDYCNENIISGDIFISIDRVKENSKKFNVDFLEELNRVIAHGVLHLMGYKDKKSNEKLEMTKMEDFALSLI